MDINSLFRISHRSGNRLRSGAAVIALTLLLILGACSGGGGGGGGDVSGQPGSSGEICITGENAYEVREESLDVRSFEAEEDPLAAAYQGNIGGQIRGVAAMNIAVAGQERNDVLIWSSGAAIRYGTPDAILATVPLRFPGAVTGLAALQHEERPWMVYGTERGVGLVGLTDEGTFEDRAPRGAYRPVPAGVLSVASNASGSRIVFASGDGYLQQMSFDELAGSEECSEILSSERVLVGGDYTYVPTKVALTDEKAFVLARIDSTIPSVAPTLEEVYDAIFAGLVADVQTSVVRGVEFDDHEVHEVGFDAADDSFHFWDSFLPTDIAADGDHLYVVGIAYKKESVQSFLASRCDGSGVRELTACMREAARDGTLTRYEENGVFAFNGGFFVYRDSDDLSKAAHFESIPLAAFLHDENAPPFVYRIAVSGDRGFVRGPNFLIRMSKESTASGGEDWVFDAEVDSRAGLIAGIPNEIIPYAGGAAASFTAVRQEDGSGASALESMAEDGSFAIVDTGAIWVKVEGGGGTKVAAIEMAGSAGGELYLENATTRDHITDLGYATAKVAHADYDGSLLAFLWTATGTTEDAGVQQGFRLAMQQGADAETRGAFTFISRQGEAVYFKSFPEIDSGEDPAIVRGVGDLFLDADHKKIVLLLSGSKEGRAYHQAALFSYGVSEERYTTSLVGISKTKIVSASSSAHRGKILRVRKTGTQYAILLSAADGLYTWTVTPGSPSQPAEGTLTRSLSVANFIDAAIDAQGGNRVALVSGYSVLVKDADNVSAAGGAAGIPRREGSTMTKPIGARLAFAGNRIMLAAPYGVEMPLLVYTTSGTSPTLAGGCPQCAFLDVDIFASFPNYLLASSIASGIEIYALSQ